MTKPLVLVIDDEVGPRESLRMILKNRYDVMLADGPEQGLKMAADARPDVVFCDIKMPEMEGPEVLRRLKELDSEVQVALITAYAAVDTAQQAVRYGAIDYITKPFSVQDIMLVADRAVEKRRQSERQQALIDELQPTARVLSGQLSAITSGSSGDQTQIYQNLTQAHNSIESQLSKIAKLNAIGEVAAEVAHDVRNFLTAILLRIEILLMDLKEPSQVNSQAVKEALQDILQAASDGAQAVQRISSISKSDPYEPFTLLSVNEVVNDVVSMSFGQFQTSQGVSIEVKTTDVPDIYGSPTALRTAVMNIVINARQALPDDGGHVTISTAAEGEDVLIIVQDTGRGIADDVMPYITEPFFTTKGAHGSGLGLSVARKVIGNHEGRIEFDSVPDRGTTVTIRLPLKSSRSQEKESTDTPEPGDPVPSVLVIEDDVEMLTNINTAIIGAGLTAEGARDAGEALQKLDGYLTDYGHAPATVITDLHMPGLLGTELARRVKNLAPDTRVILVSGYITEEATHISSPHVDAIIKKPFRFPDLLRQISPPV
ncbi:MAG: response regulator [Armatimonadia bacterium]